MRAGILLSDEAGGHPVQGSAFMGCNDLARVLLLGGWTLDERLVGRDDDVPGPCEVIVNVVSDPDLCPRALDRIEAMLPRLGVPLLNRPEAVRATRRDRLSERLAGAPGLVCPPTVRLACRDPAAFAAEATDRLGLPLLARPAGSHTGRHLARCADRESLARHAATLPPGLDWYVTPFVDTRGPDGFYRKVRLIVAGDTVLPRHLLADEDWNVHGGALHGTMKRRAALRDEEQRLLDRFDEVWPAPARNAVAALRDAVGLDYFGIDGTLLPDGRLLLFEANATMNILPITGLERFAYRAPGVARVQAAAVAMTARAAAAGPPAQDL